MNGIESNFNTLYTKQTKWTEKKQDIFIYFHGDIQIDSMANEIFCKNKRFIQLKLCILPHIYISSVWIHSHNAQKKHLFGQSNAKAYIT